MNHTPEPWQANGEFVGTVGDDPQTIAYTSDHRNHKTRPVEQRWADARRIAACVNACAGIPTEALETAGEKPVLGLIEAAIDTNEYDRQRDAGEGALFEAVRALDEMPGEPGKPT